MSDEFGGAHQHAAESQDQAPESHERTLTDLMDEIGREAFSRSLSKRPTGSRHSDSRENFDD